MEDEISDGVKILCDRMENNPEDFVDSTLGLDGHYINPGKYAYEGKEIECLAKGEPNQFWFLNETEKRMLCEAYLCMARQQYTASVVSRLYGAVPEVKKRSRGPLTGAQITRESLALLEESFEHEYAKQKHVMSLDANTDTLRYAPAHRYKLEP